MTAGNSWMVERVGSGRDTRGKYTRGASIFILLTGNLRDAACT